MLIYSERFQSLGHITLLSRDIFKNLYFHYQKSYGK